MKKTIIVSCFILFSVITITGQSTGTNIQDNINNARERLGNKLLSTADEIIREYIEAIGGREAILSIKSIMVRGRNARFGKGDTPLIRRYESSGYFRQMRLLNDTTYILSDGQKTWSVNPSARKEITEWWGKALSHERIDGNFIDYKNRGIEYEYLGLEGFETEPSVYYHLNRIFPDGYTEKLYFDIETNLLHCIWSTSSPIKDSPKIFYDYRKVGSVLFPHAWMRVHNQAAPPHLFIVEEIKINEDFGKDIFK